MVENPENVRKVPDEGERKVYEVGYFLVPLIAESELSNEVAKVQLAIEKHKGISISDEFPAMRGLAYGMRKAVHDRNQVFETGYFGWIKFEMAPENVPGLKNDLSIFQNILRFTLIHTVRENNFFMPKSPVLGVKPPGTIEGGEIQERATTISDEELDKSIEELIAE